jgi:hypothetical protein
MMDGRRVARARESDMRHWLILLVVVIQSASGCTHLALERRTLNQASTLSNLQYQQVLDNLALFACNPDALPWHLKLNGASVQVTDQGTGLFAFSWGGGKSGSYAPSLTAQRGIVNQWSGIPTVDPDSLELLSLAYQKALCPQDPNGTIRERIMSKIGELALVYDLVLTKETLDKVIDGNPHLEPTNKWQLKRKNEDLHEQLNKVFDQIAKLSRPPTEVEVDNYAQKLSAKLTDETRGEARAKLQAQQAQQSVTATQMRVGVEDQLVKLVREAKVLPYIPRYPYSGRAEHNPHDIHQAEEQINVLLQLAEDGEYLSPWICVARSRTGLPCDVCYVGHYCGCGCDCYVGVPPNRIATLRDFTLAVLTLAPIAAEESVPGLPTSSVTFSPTISGGGH